MKKTKEVVSLILALLLSFTSINHTVYAIQNELNDTLNMNNIKTLSDYIAHRANNLQQTGTIYSFPSNTYNPFGLQEADSINYDVIFQDAEKDYRDQTFEEKQEYLNGKKEELNEPLWKDGTMQVWMKHIPDTLDNPVPKNHLNANAEKWFDIADPSGVPHTLLREASRVVSSKWSEEFVGTWQVNFAASDTTGRSEFDMRGVGTGFVTVQRPPRAIIDRETAAGSYPVRVSASYSYDPDYQFRKSNNGIASFQWYYQLDGGSWIAATTESWLSFINDGVFWKKLQINALPPGAATYDIGLLVTDTDGTTGWMTLGTMPATLEAIIGINNDNPKTGRLGSDPFSISFLGNPPMNIINYKYSIPFSSQSGNLSNTPYANSGALIIGRPPRQIDFTKNTMKYSATTSLSKQVRLELNNNTASAAKNITFTRVSIENMWLAESEADLTNRGMRYVPEHSEFVLVVQTQNASPSPVHEIRLWFDGEREGSPTHNLISGGNNLWYCKLKAPKAEGTTRYVPVYVEVYNGSIEDVIYDANDIGNTSPGIIREIPVLAEPEAELRLAAKKYEGEVITTDLEMEGTNYGYKGEHIYVQSLEKDGSLVTKPTNDGLNRKTEWSGAENPISSVTSTAGDPLPHEQKIGEMNENTYHITQKTSEYLSLSDFLNRIQTVTSETLDIIKANVNGKALEDALIGGNIILQAQVEKVKALKDIRVFAVVKYKQANGSWKETDPIALEQVGTTDTFENSYTIPTDAVEGEGFIDYYVESTRSGELSSPYSMHVIAEDRNKAFHLRKLILVVPEMVTAWATYKETLEVTAADVPEDWKIYADLAYTAENSALNGVISPEAFQQIGNTFYSRFEKEAPALANTITDSTILYRVTNAEGKEVPFGMINQEGSPIQNARLRVITPKIRTPILTKEEVNSDASLTLRLETENMNLEKYFVQAEIFVESDNIEYIFPGEGAVANGNIHTWTLQLPGIHEDGTEILSNKAGDYTIRYKIVSRNDFAADRNVDQQDKGLRINGFIRNARIIDMATGEEIVRANGQILGKLIPDRRYKYVVESSINIGEMDLIFYSDAAKITECFDSDNVRLVETNARRFYEWSFVIERDKTLEISDFYNQSMGDKTSWIVDSHALISGVTKDGKEITDEDPFMTETKLQIDEQMNISLKINKLDGGALTDRSNLQKNLGERTLDFGSGIDGSIPAGEGLTLKDVQIVSNVPLSKIIISSNVLEIPEREIAVPAAHTNSLFAETEYIYDLPEIDLGKIRSNVRDGSYTVKILGIAKNGTYKESMISFQVYSPIWESYKNGRLEPIARPLQNVPEVFMLSSEAIFEEENTVQFITSKYTSKVKISMGNIQFYAWKSGRFSLKEDGSDAIETFVVDNGLLKYGLKDLRLETNGHEYRWTFKMGSIVGFPLEDNKSYEMSFLGYDGAGEWSTSNNKNHLNPQIKSILALGIKLFDFQVTNITDRSFKDIFVDAETEQKTGKVFPVAEMVIDQTDHPNGNRMKRGYAFYFTISSKGLQGEEDTIRIRPSFYTADTREPLDMYYETRENPYAKATTNPATELRDPKDTTRIFYESGMINLLGYHNEIFLPPSLRRISGSDQIWEGRYGIPPTAIFVKKDQEPWIQDNRIKTPVIVVFDIEGIKNGEEKYNYIDKGQWEEERLSDAGIPSNPIKYNQYDPGEVILIDPVKSVSDDYEAVKTHLYSVPGR